MPKNEKYSYYTKFKIRSEKDIDDFWSFVIFRLNVENDKLVYDRFARLYNLLLEHKHELNQILSIFLYETSEHFLIKIKTNITVITNRAVARLMKYGFSYQEERNFISYEINKVSPVHKVPAKKKEVKIVKPIERELFILDFIKADDLEDLLNILEKMQDRNYQEVSTIPTIEELNDYKACFSYFASIIKGYDKLTIMSNIVAELSVIISLYIDECYSKGSECRASFSAFINSLEVWCSKLFKEGCESIDFMDASFTADLAQFKMLIGLYDEVEDINACSLDDIFDF